MILFLLAPLTPDKIREFGDFTLVNPAKFDRLRKALKSLKSRFEKGINETQKRKLDAAFHAAVE
jgi:hypothetical protein